MDSQEEAALLRQYKIQRARETSASHDQDSTVVDTPNTLQEFHRMRTLSNGASLFGNTAYRDRDRTMSSSTSTDNISQKTRSSRGQRSAPTTPTRSRMHSVGEQSFFSDRETSSSEDHHELGSPTSLSATDYRNGLASTLRAQSGTSNISTSPPLRSTTNTPQLRPLKALTPDAMVRISKVLEDLEMDITGKISRHQNNISESSAFSSAESIEEDENEETIDPLLAHLSSTRPSPIPFSNKYVRNGASSTLQDALLSVGDSITREKTPTLQEPLHPFPKSPNSFPESPLSSLEPPADITPTHGTPEPPRTPSRSDSELETPYQIVADRFGSPDLSEAQLPGSPPSQWQTTTVSDETDFSNAPSAILSAHYTSANRSTTSLASTGSSYCADYGYESDDPLQEKQTNPFEFDSLAELASSSAEVEMLREDAGLGLNIQDIAYIQSELVRAASQRKAQLQSEDRATEASPIILQEPPAVPDKEERETLLVERAISQDSSNLRTPSLMEPLPSPSVSTEDSLSIPPTPLDSSMLFERAPLSAKDDNLIAGEDYCSLFFCD